MELYQTHTLSFQVAKISSTVLRLSSFLSTSQQPWCLAMYSFRLHVCESGPLKE